MREVNGVPVWDTLSEMIAPAHTALVIVDMQNDCVSPGGWFEHNGRDVTFASQIIQPIQTLVSSARRAGTLIVYTRQTTLPGNASDSPAWLHFKTRDGRTRTDYTLPGTWGHAVIDALAPDSNDVIVDKFRPSAFLGTSLDLILRANAVDTVIVTGAITQGCVQATVMDASFHDYYTVVVGDCVASHSSELHQVAMTFMRSRYEVADSAAVIDVWNHNNRTVQ